LSRGYLLDTNVLSATAPDRRTVADAAKNAARGWIRVHGDQLWLPVVAIAEIAAGIGEREGAGATHHAAELSAWLRRLLSAYPTRILGYGVAEALCSQKLSLAARRRGIQVGFADMAVAGIAVTHDLIVATRNTRHFDPIAVPTMNPFAAD
jgi:predicted nucleic acid-binding protein